MNDEILKSAIESLAALHRAILSIERCKVDEISPDQRRQCWDVVRLGIAIESALDNEENTRRKCRPPKQNSYLHVRESMY